MQRGEIYLASFPYGDVAVMKLRPVLLLTGPVGVGTEFIVAYISSVPPGALLASDVLIDPSQPEHQVHAAQNRLGAAVAQTRYHSRHERAALHGEDFNCHSASGG